VEPPAIEKPFTHHTYEGVPPLTGVAVNVTLVPEQMVVPVLLVMLTDVGIVGFTVMLIVLLVAVPAVTQVSEVVTTQYTGPVTGLFVV
jgi:hypothetical protein